MSEIKNLIYALNENKASDPGSIPTMIMKRIAPTLSKYLCKIINSDPTQRRR